MAPQDSFIDEDDDCCPLCVEEFDLSDKGFRPCPCGYQICQFCFNNIKTNMNNLCPACRRPYDEKTIEWKVVTQEELKQHQANIQKNAKKKADQRQRELQKREVESMNRKHLSGLRVVQKNLVYVVGLSPSIRDDEILATLRGPQYFGQYGQILKIVVSKAKSGEPGQSSNSLGIYVTFAKKEDAQKCINAVNGSQNGDRVLRAQLGTTKYCSAFLRNEVCTNKSCMFLHESSDTDDSYSRQDMSSFNSVVTQAPLPGGSSAGQASRQAARAQAPIQHAQPVAAAAQPMARDPSKDESDSGDGSALPSSASWAKQRSRRGSLATSGAASSPAISQSMPVMNENQTELPEPTQEYQEPEHTIDVTIASDVVSATGSKPERDPVLMNLLKSINCADTSFSLRSPAGDGSDLASFPPLFDEHGGEKRRAMREQQQQEEDKLQLEQEQDSQLDQRSMGEPVEEDEPESGSLQLGGEPEDSNIGRENNLPQFQRRPSSQLPIQRTPNGGAFGPSISQTFPQINGRTLTPLQQQQLLLMKSSQQPGFMDHFPPGMGNSLGQASGSFQPQGHTRQPSRYASVMESSSAAIKGAANPKFLAQQSSMMPQQPNQYYGSSVAGPPPGLKSSGTPPIFGQGHGFGGSLFGAKENGADLGRDMARGRGVAGASQLHDAGKREYNFPSFLQQYPSASSTPAPASGLLASLYGPQTGAFHDYGQKQKKKGKKHRHANTSSSGGSGLVNDLVDPSILQARMQQYQQQSNAGVGQGLFGGQAQDDSDLTIDDAPFSVDELVSDEDPTLRIADPFVFASRSSTPAVPPGFGPPGFGPPGLSLPGIGLPQAHLEHLAREEPLPKTLSRIAPNAPVFIPGAPTPLTNISVPLTPTKAPRTPKVSKSSQAKQDVKTLASDSGLSKTIASQSSAQVSLKAEEFPALESGKGKEALATAVTPKSATPAKKSNAVKILDTSNAVKKGPNPTLAPSLFPALPPSTPLVSVAQGPTPRPNVITAKASKALPTTKAETPTSSMTPSSAVSTYPLNSQSSRQPSIASIAKLERSGSPTSEIISDNASTTSVSISRANSPPPSKVGSAPVRLTTKSMQKKQRQQQKEKATQLELDAAAAAAAATKIEQEPEIAPIMGRKKKQKKEKVTRNTAGGSTPVVSRPTSPGPVSIGSKFEFATKGEHTVVPETTIQPEKEPVQSPAKSSDLKAKGKNNKPQRAASPEPVSAVTEPEDPPERLSPTPSSTLRELMSAGEIADINSTLFRPINLGARHQDAQADQLKPNPKLVITEQDQADLVAGKPVRKIIDGQRILMTPNGNCLRNLSFEEEQRYLQLQVGLAHEAGPTSFVSGKVNSKNRFTLIGGRAVPSGLPSFLVEPFVPIIDPVSKIQHEEALSYINQYVLPSISANPQLEKALNANALDAEVMRSGNSLLWGTSAGQHSDEGKGPFGEENILENMLSVNHNDRSQPLSNVSMLSTSEAEHQLQFLRKETEGFEKRVFALMKKNKRLLSGH